MPFNTRRWAAALSLLLLIAAIARPALAQSLQVENVSAGVDETGHLVHITYSPGANSAAFDFRLGFDARVIADGGAISANATNGDIICKTPKAGELACIAVPKSGANPIGSVSIVVPFSTGATEGAVPLVIEASHFFDTTGAPQSGTATNGQINITNSVPPTISILGGAIYEGNSGSRPLSFVVSLSRPAPSGGVSAKVAIAAGTATAGLDYTGASSTSVSIPAGQRQAVVAISVVGDLYFEPDETVLATLSQPTGATLAIANAVGVVLNDDEPAIPPVLAFDSYTTAVGQALTVSAGNGLLANDTPTNGSPLSASLLAQAAHGVAAVSGDGSFKYTPTNGYSGIDVFAYRACDSLGQCTNSTATILIGSLRFESADHYLWTVPPEVGANQQGFVRISNLGASAGDVVVWGIDGLGQRSRGALYLSLGPKQSVQANSYDLENGNPAKGLYGALGAGNGFWTLVVHSALDVEALAYARTADGFLTSLHDRALGDGVDWFVPVLNPGSNLNQQSLLRIINTTPNPVDYQIAGRDDAGVAGDSLVTGHLAPFASTFYFSSNLENGGWVGTGALGKHTGKWSLDVSATDRIAVQSLLYSGSSLMTNLSTLADPSMLNSGERQLWFFPPASNPNLQGFIRIINREPRSGTVAVWGIDGAGHRSTGTVTFSLEANASKQMNSTDLEQGSLEKALIGKLGTGIGNWRLMVLTDLNVDLMAMARTPDGFLTSIHDSMVGTSLRIPTFNPGSNPNQVSELRLVNPSASAVKITIQGLDDAGHASGLVTLTLAAGAATELTSLDLENGNSAKGLSGRMGIGTGKWALTITAPVAIRAMSLLHDPNGYLTNLTNRTNGASGTLGP